VRKVEAARAALNAVNPEVEIVEVAARVEGDLVDQLISQVDIVVDCSDNFATRHALNRGCVRQRKPLVSGAAMRFDGQVAVFDLSKADSPCYACLFPEDVQVEEVQCSVMGVFAPLTGVVGALQAMEAIKVIAQVGESLNGRLLLVDAKNGDWRSVKIAKDPGCKVCSR
jgi:molybdopterin/thiamine biosynthesis adenylyltransferase